MVALDPRSAFLIAADAGGARIGRVGTRSSRRPLRLTGAVMVKPFNIDRFQTGRTVTERDMLGRPAVVFFGFNLLPRSLSDDSRRYQQIGSVISAPMPIGSASIFVTVDPARAIRRAEGLAKYLTLVRSAHQGADRKTPPISTAVAKAFGIYYKRVNIEGGGFNTIGSHRPRCCCSTRTGRFAGTISYQEEKRRPRFAKAPASCGAACARASDLHQGRSRFR